MRLSVILPVILALSACSATLPKTTSAVPTAITTHYLGDVKFMSQDSARSWGNTVSLVKRIVYPAERRIIETVTQPPRNSGLKAQEYRTVMNRVGASNEFSVEDEAKTFSGTISFTGLEWNWTGWTYNITLKDGATLKGTGTLDANGIHTTKELRNGKGEVAAEIKEDLAPVTEEIYLKWHKEILRDAK
jgi:hypothetical protein